MALGSKVAFELAVGVNGRVWVKAGSVSETILAANAIRNSELIPATLHGAMVARLLKVSATA